LNHPEGSGTLSAPSDPSATTGSTTVLQAAAVGGGVPVVSTVSGPDPASQTQRAIHSSVKVIEPNYTVAAGDTLVKIAGKFNTSVDRIQASNTLSDPRVLRIGSKLIAPPNF